LEFSDGLGTWFLAFFAFEIGVFTLAGWTGFRKYPHLRVFGEPFSRIILFLMLGPSMNSSAAVCVSRGTISIPTALSWQRNFCPPFSDAIRIKRSPRTFWRIFEP
jgi:hypothetical protein